MLEGAKMAFTRGDRNEEHKDGSFGVPVANGCGDRGKPLFRVSVEFILDDFVIVQGDSDNKGAQESSYHQRTVRELSVNKYTGWRVL